MTELPSPQPTTRNHVRAVGTLSRRGAARGAPELRLHVPAPFGASYTLPIHVEHGASGASLLDQRRAGALLAIDGHLEWETRRGEEPQRGDLTFWASAVRAAAEADEPGCDVWLAGVVAAPARILRHPRRGAIVLAETILQVQVEHTRRSSRARIVETGRVPVAVPLHHAEATRLLRPGNRVIVEGLLERIVVELRGAAVDQALAELDAELLALRGQPAEQPGDREARERQLIRRRWWLWHSSRSRVVAGYVELVEGQPASLREARELRRAMLRARHREQPAADKD